MEVVHFFVNLVTFLTVGICWVLTIDNYLHKKTVWRYAKMFIMALMFVLLLVIVFSRQDLIQYAAFFLVVAITIVKTQHNDRLHHS
jgi:cytochrome bd-type quinol oxidase subunit 2